MTPEPSDEARAKAPNPGSDAALDAGCLCPVLDNGRGRGWMGGVKDEDGEAVFVMRDDCPLHGFAIRRSGDPA